jgi:hypothetical protein
VTCAAKAPERSQARDSAQLEASLAAAVTGSELAVLIQLMLGNSLGQRGVVELVCIATRGRQSELTVRQGPCATGDWPAWLATSLYLSGGSKAMCR